ncbi:MAG TPA: hypothetical protein VGD84_10065, partial [Pseudonocardiaceae bacterium]
LLAFGGDVVARLVVVGVLVFGWLVVLGWWWLRLRRYLRSLVPAALGRLMRRSHARWGLGGIVGSVACAVVAVWTQPAVLVAGYTVLLGGAGLSRALVVRDRRRAALDRS